MLNSDQTSAILNQHMFLLCTFCADIIYSTSKKTKWKTLQKNDTTLPYTPAYIHITEINWTGRTLKTWYLLSKRIRAAWSLIILKRSPNFLLFSKSLKMKCPSECWSANAVLSFRSFFNWDQIYERTLQFLSLKDLKRWLKNWVSVLAR